MKNSEIYLDMSIKQIKKLIFDSLGIDERTINNIMKKYNETKSVIVGKQKRQRKSYRDSFDEFAKKVWPAYPKHSVLT